MTYTIFNTFRPYDFGTDAIERQRVSLGQSIIDADFEYGLQGTKWQAYQEVRKTPGFFEIPGTDLTVTNVVSDGASPQSLVEVSVLPAPGTAGSFTTSTNMVQTIALATTTSTVGTPVAGRVTIMCNVPHYITPGLTFLVEIAGVTGGTTGTLNGTHTATSIGYYNYTIAAPAGATGTFTFNSGTSTSKFLTAIGFLQSGSATGQVTNGQFLTGTVINNTIAGVVTLAGWGAQTPGGTISGTLLYSNQTWITGTIASSTTLSTTSGFNPQHMQGFEPNGTVTTAAVNQTITNSAGTLTISKTMTVPTSANHNVATGTVMTVQITGTAISAGSGILDGIYTATASAANQYTIDATTYGANGTFTMTGSTTKFLTHIGVPIQNPTNMGTSYQITNTGTLTMVAPPALTTVTTISNHGIPIGSTFTVFLTGTGNGVLNATAFRATSTAVNQYTITIPTAAGTGGIAVGTSCFFPMLAGVYSSTGTPITINAAPSTTTITTSNPHNIPIGMTFSFTIVGTTRATGATDTVLNGTYTGISTATNTFTFISLNTSSSTWNTPGSNFQLFMPSAVTSLAKYIGGSINIIQSTPVNNPPFSAPVYTISYAQQTWLTASIPALETFIAVSTATPGTQPYTANVVSISGLLNVTKTADRAEGYFPLLGISTGNNLAYLAKGAVPSGQLSTSYTVIRRGGLFNNGNARLQGITSISQTASPNTVTVTTSAPHGLIPGTPIAVVGWMCAGDSVNGNYFLETVPSTTQFTYTPRQAAVQAGIVGGYIFVQTYSSAVHRPFDGGVLLAAGQPTYGSNIVRQSKKVFRYQSGKGLLWSSGTLFCPNNDIVAISSAGTAIGSLVSIVSEIANGLPQAGAQVQVTGVTSTGFNTVGSSFYTINNVIESTTATMLSLNTISGVTATTVSSITFTGDGTTATATATAHGLITGLAVAITGASIGGYNTTGVTITVTGPNTFTYPSIGSGAATGGVATTYRATLSDQSRFIMRNWHGSSVRAGCFEDQNGLFWEYDGQTLFVVKRTSTFQLTGLVSCTYLGQTLTGDGSTRFLDQLRIGDRFVIRGMAHTVTNIASQNVLTFNPPYRGTVEITALNPVRACKVKDIRVPQSQFNRDKLDGTGNSGFTVNVAKMQMIGIQYTWYGAGFVDFMMRGLDGNWVMAHRIYNNNVNDEAYMRTGNLPVRYELTNECASAISTLATTIVFDEGTLLLTDPDGTNLAYWPSSGTVLIDNELIRYTSKTTFSLAGLTRGASLVYNIADTNRTFTGGPATGHNAGTTVNLVSSTCTPSLTHWGSALLMDGQFDNDRGYFFNYTFNQGPLTYSAGPPVVNQTVPLFFLRLSPSVSNGIVGDIGARDLLNRAQLLLQKLDCSVVGTGVTLNVNGILNPVGFENSTFPWLNINSVTQGSQPSFTQYCNYSTLTLNGGSYVAGSGERIFSLVAQGGSVSTIDLSALKELSNTVIGGNRMFPDGPDTLMIIATNLNAALTNAVLNLYWTEAQA
jgi:hypothetical protein